MVPLDCSTVLLQKSPSRNRLHPPTGDLPGNVTSLPRVSIAPINYSGAWDRTRCCAPFHSASAGGEYFGMLKFTAIPASLFPRIMGS